MCGYVFAEPFHQLQYNFNMAIINSLISFVLALPSPPPQLASRKTFISPHLLLSDSTHWFFRKKEQKQNFSIKGWGVKKKRSVPRDCADLGWMRTQRLQPSTLTIEDWQEGDLQAGVQGHQLMCCGYLPWSDWSQHRQLIRQHARSFWTCISW